MFPWFLGFFEQTQKLWVFSCSPCFKGGVFMKHTENAFIIYVHPHIVFKFGVLWSTHETCGFLWGMEKPVRFFMGYKLPVVIFIPHLLLGSVFSFPQHAISPSLSFILLQYLPIRTRRKWWKEKIRNLLNTPP